jgi:NAD(P)-dependent dehydrogenase (short-subunit alcohol dehydrogenase family)
MHGEGMDIRGRSALVTGGGRGLGAALGETLARQGARVVLVARNVGELAEVAARIRSAGGEAHALAFDVGDKEAAHRITGAAAELVGPIDILAHAASTLGPLPMPFLLDTACEDLAAVLETNLVGPFRMDKIVAGSMALRKTGVIVHVSSDAAVSGYPKWGAYGISKAAFDQLARVLGAELAEHGVKVFSVDPGEMDTRMHADAMPDLSEAERAALAKPAVIADKIAEMIAGAERIEPGARLIAPSWSAP